MSDLLTSSYLVIRSCSVKHQSSIQRHLQVHAVIPNFQRHLCKICGNVTRPQEVFGFEYFVRHKLLGLQWKQDKQMTSWSRKLLPDSVECEMFWDTYICFVLRVERDASLMINSRLALFKDFRSIWLFYKVTKLLRSRSTAYYTVKPISLSRKGLLQQSDT